jgi:hypothetical protein
MKIDIGCGKNKREGFIGVDSIKFDTVDVHFDVTSGPWPWEDGSVEEIHCSHFLEHLTREQWVPFFNEAHRVLQEGGKLTVITPHWSHACAYGDPTHKSFLSEWVPLYLNKAWRDQNAPHVGYTCDFDNTVAGSWDGWLNSKHSDMVNYAMQHYTNSYRDLILNLTKRPKS